MGVGWVANETLTITHTHIMQICERTAWPNRRWKLPKILYRTPQNCYYENFKYMLLITVCSEMKIKKKKNPREFTPGSWKSNLPGEHGCYEPHCNHSLNSICIPIWATRTNWMQACRISWHLTFRGTEWAWNTQSLGRHKSMKSTAQEYIQLKCSQKDLSLNSFGGNSITGN